MLLSLWLLSLEQENLAALTLFSSRAFSCTLRRWWIAKFQSFNGVADPMILNIEAHPVIEM